MKRKLIGLIIVAAVVAVGWRCLLFVDQAEFVIVTEFGQPVRTWSEAGLHVKLPYQSALRIDKRLQIYDPRPSEFSTSKKEPIDLDVFVCWRVTDPQQFIETVNDFPGAEARLHDIVWSELAATVGQNALEAVVSTQPDSHRLDRIVGDVAKASAERAKAAYGIEIVDVRLKRIGVPEQVRESVFQRMRTERARMAEGYRAEGDMEATKIRAQADKDRTVTLAGAYAEAEKTRGDGEARAARLYAKAHQKDPELYELIRTLAAYRKLLDEKTTLLLSSESDLLKYLTRGATTQPWPAKKERDGR